MAGLAHLSIALASKPIAPEVPLGALVLGSYAIDIVWGVFFFAGIENYPSPGLTATSPWSHGLFMSLVWSIAAALIAAFICRDLRISVFIGLLAFSHWVVDFITKPMLAVFPTDLGLPIFFENSSSLGLGLYSYQIGVNIGEYGSFVLGAVIYIIFIVRTRRKVIDDKNLNQ